MMIGADCEFGIMTPDGRSVNLVQIIDCSYSAERFGFDHFGAVAELRPKPADNPRGLVDNIRQVMQFGLSTYPELQPKRWVAGSYFNGTAIGGHIHFETGRMGSERLVPLLDVFLAPILLVLENQSQARKRRQEPDHYTGVCYGKLSDRRYPPYGLEYRTLSSWLLSPGIALGTLAIALALAKVAVKAGREYSRLKAQMGRLRVPEDRFNRADCDFFRPRVGEIFGLLGKIESVRQFWPEVCFLRQQIELGREWDNGSDLKVRWNLIPF